MIVSFACDTCFDTHTIDQGGREIACPDCPGTVTVKLTGLAHGLGCEGKRYITAVGWSPSTIIFKATPRNITADLRRVRLDAERAARAEGLTGRNYLSSWAIAIERRVLNQLKEQS